MPVLSCWGCSIVSASLIFIKPKGKLACSLLVKVLTRAAVQAIVLYLCWGGLQWDRPYKHAGLQLSWGLGPFQASPPSASAAEDLGPPSHSPAGPEPWQSTGNIFGFSWKCLELLGWCWCGVGAFPAAFLQRFCWDGEDLPAQHCDQARLQLAGQPRWCPETSAPV